MAVVATIPLKAGRSVDVPYVPGSVNSIGVAAGGGDILVSTGGHAKPEKHDGRVAASGSIPFVSHISITAQNDTTITVNR